MQNTLNKPPAKSVIRVQVKRRVPVPTHGWATHPVQEPKHIIPTLQQLVYDIYDTQRKIIGEFKPKRMFCSVPVPVTHIERIIKMAPLMTDFDGMTFHQALEFYRPQAQAVGIRREDCIPLIFSKKIRVRSHAFSNGYAFVFEQRDGFRYMIQSTQQEFYWLSSNRQVLNNLSYHLNQKYNCNLHIASDEAMRSYENTGINIEHNRHLFTAACEYYINPRLLSIQDFIRCQIKELRGYEDISIDALIKGDDDSIMAFSPTLAYELDKAKAIYLGKIKQYIGDFSKERIVDAT